VSRGGRGVGDEGLLGGFQGKKTEIKDLLLEEKKGTLADLIENKTEKTAEAFRSLKEETSTRKS